MTESDVLWRELRRLWPHLLPEKQAQVVELARLHSLSPTIRRLLHELVDLHAAQGREAVAQRLREMRAALVVQEPGTPSPDVPPERSAASGEILQSLDQDHGFEDLVRLVEAQHQLGPLARRFAMQFVEALAESDLAAASAAGRAAFEQVEREFRQRVHDRRRRGGDPHAN